MLYVLCCNAIAKSEASNTKKHCLSADNQFVAIIVKSRVRVAFVLAIAVKAIKQCAG